MSQQTSVLKIKELLIERLLFLCSLLSVFTTAAIIYVLLSETIGFFKEVSFFDFLTDTQWTPLFTNKHFGILPLLSGTFLTTVIAVGIAIPVGLISAVYLSEYASARVRNIIKPMMEILAALRGTPYSPPQTLAEKIPLILKHCELSIGFKGETRGLLEMRKHLAWYVKGFPGAGELRKKLVQVNSMEEIRNILESVK